MLWKIISTVFVIHLCVYTKGVPEKSTQRNKFVKVAHNIKNIQRVKKSFEPSYERPNRSRKIGVFVTSFNTNANIPEGNDLKLWLNLEKKKDEELDGIMPDLVVIGLQEIVKLNPGNATRDAFQAMTNIQSPKVSKWINTLSEELNQYHYACKGFVPMFGLLLVLYHRRKQLDSSRASPSNEDDTISLTKMRTAKVQTGLGKQVQTAMRNKGAVAISLLLNNSVWVCFVNAHLSHGAGPDNLRERNRDYFTIIKEMNFATKGHPPFTILQHDVVFWVGDLNYRLSYEGSGLNREQTIAWSKGSLKELLLLLPYDELRKQIQVDETMGAKNGHAAPAFGVFREADINYAPTYKHDKNTSDDNYDTSKKQRWPAWTDRILYWISDTFVSNQSENISSEKDLELEQTCYESVPKIKREGILNGFPNDAPPPAFTSFEEQPITFLPTYKYDPGTDKYDTSPKKRFPAWCDRILYQTDLDLVQTSYESVPPPFDSDQENSEFLSIPKKEKKHRNRLRKKLRSASHTQDSSGASPKQPKSRERLTKAPPAG